MKAFAERSARFQRRSERVTGVIAITVGGLFVLVALSFMFGVLLALLRALLGTD